MLIAFSDPPRGGDFPIQSGERVDESGGHLSQLSARRDVCRCFRPPADLDQVDDVGGMPVQGGVDLPGVVVFLEMPIPLSFAVKPLAKFALVVSGDTVGFHGAVAVDELPQLRHPLGMSPER